MTVWRRRKSQRERAQVEAQDALRESVDRLHGTVMRGYEVRKIASQLRQIQQDNGFGPAIAKVYERGPS